MLNADLVVKILISADVQIWLGVYIWGSRRTSLIFKNTNFGVAEKKHMVGWLSHELPYDN
jgi:hypothetical protein